MITWLLFSKSESPMYLLTNLVSHHILPLVNPDYHSTLTAAWQFLMTSPMKPILLVRPIPAQVLAKQIKYEKLRRHAKRISAKRTYSILSTNQKRTVPAKISSSVLPIPLSLHPEEPKYGPSTEATVSRFHPPFGSLGDLTCLHTTSPLHSLFLSIPFHLHQNRLAPLTISLPNSAKPKEKVGSGILTKQDIVNEWSWSE